MKILSVNIKIIEQSMEIIKANSTIDKILKRYAIIIKAISMSNAWQTLYLMK